MFPELPEVTGDMDAVQMLSLLPERGRVRWKKSRFRKFSIADLIGSCDPNFICFCGLSCEKDILPCGEKICRYHFRLHQEMCGYCVQYDAYDTPHTKWYARVDMPSYPDSVDDAPVIDIVDG